MGGKKRNQLNLWFWGIVAVLFVSGILWCYRSSLTTSTIKFAVAQAGTITHESEVMATFANEEIPILSPISGKLQYVGEEGQRFRRGEVVANVQADGAAPGTVHQNASNQAIQAVAGGLFFHQSDGLESILTCNNLISMDLDKLLAVTANVKTPGETVQAGEVVGKIVNNFTPTLAFLELPSISGLTVGKTIKITTENQTLSAKILRKSDQPKGLIVQFPYYVDGSVVNRRHEVTWIYSPPVAGVLVPKSALWTKGEEQGVFLCSEGVVQFKKVTILDQNDSQVCIENIPSGIPVVITPRDGLEGLVADVKNI